MTQPSSSTDETQNMDKKSLRVLTGKNPAWAALAQDCVCFANGRGGSILIGIEDEAEAPDPDQQIPTDLLDRIRKRIYGREGVASLHLASIKVLSHKVFDRT